MIGRAVTPQEITSFKENVTYKDIDWRSRERKLFLGPRRKLFLEQLEKDCKVKIFFIIHEITKSLSFSFF